MKDEREKQIVELARVISFCRLSNDYKSKCVFRQECPETWDINDTEPETWRAFK